MTGVQTCALPILKNKALVMSDVAERSLCGALAQYINPEIGNSNWHDIERKIVNIDLSYRYF